MDITPQRTLAILLVISALAVIANSWGDAAPSNRAEKKSADAAVAAPLAERCSQVAATLRHRLDDGCRVLVRVPFVLAGDCAQADLEDLHRETIAPAARIISSRYATTRPHAPIVVLLFTEGVETADGASE